jgi:diaminohydroxyphosphoribosylaminopyrimidine deaminase/5-amino-6-(5-phosphoribosylamino)uracil reductase
LVAEYGEVFDGATHAPGGHHAEREALNAAGELARGATLYVTLEPCNHQGRTGPCTQAIIDAGVARVIIGMEDPDENVSGSGIEALKAAGIEIIVGVEEDAVRQQLAPYITHRTTGRPHVILKLAQTLDGHIAAPDGTSQWITGAEARADVHRLRAESDAIIVGAGTLRADDPTLTVRDFTPTTVDEETPVLDPWRIVLGSAKVDARSAPIESWTGDLGPLLDDLGSRNMLQVLVEGGAHVAGSFHRAGLVDEYWIYVAPAIMGGDDATTAFAGEGAPTMSEIRRGEFVSVTQLGADVRLVMR